MNGFQGVVFIGSGKIAFGKLSQALDYGALTLQIEGDFDTCLARVRQVSSQLGLYLMNSVNPFRLEGQKTIMYRILESLSWQPPDWIIVPGGNLGNCSAFGKAFLELRQHGLIKRIPRLAIINAEGANTLYSMVKVGISWNGGHINQAAIDAFYADMDHRQLHAHTVASAIEIGRPVNLKKALRALDVMKGVVAQVSDNDILEAKAMVGRFGFACEPASAATIAGLRQLLANGTISRHERAWVNAAVMPLSLKLPEGFMPSYCSQSCPGHMPSSLPRHTAFCKKVCPSPTVQIMASAANGKSSRKRHTPE